MSLIDGRISRHPGRRLCGFSLVEIAAVGCVATLGLAMTMPALHRVRRDGALTACLDNLRALGSASLTYASEDSAEQFIPVPVLSVLDAGSGAFEWGGKAGRGESSVPGEITYSHYGTRAYRGPARPLNPYLHPGGFPDWNPVGGTPNPGPGDINYLSDAALDLPEFRCPADTGYAGGGFLYTANSHLGRSERPFRDEGLTAYDHYGTSYAAAVRYSVGGCGGRMTSRSLYLTPLSRIQDPAHTLGYREVPGQFAWLWGSWAGSGCEFAGYETYLEGNFNSVPGWHGRAFWFNATFADGHAASVEIRGCLRPAPNIGNLTFVEPCGSSQPYTCFRCVIDRGPGWQLDTMPAEGVPAPWDWPCSPNASQGGTLQ